MQPKAILVGNSDGIGLAATRRLLAAGWDVIGFSRNTSPITSTNYQYRIADVSDNKYPDLLDELVRVRSCSELDFDVRIYDIINYATDRVDLCGSFAP